MAEQTDAKRRNRQRTVLVIILIILFLLLLGLGYFIFSLLSPSGAPTDDETPDGLTWIRSIYGYGPSAAEQFVRPNDGAVGSGGTIWVSDGQRARILGFAPDGSYRSVIEQGPEGAGPGRLWRPDALDVDDDGNVFIADYANNKIIVITEDNEFLREWPVAGPQEVAVSGDRVVVGTLTGLSVFDTEGQSVTQIGSRGSDADQFDTARGVVIGEDGNVYVADTHNQRVKAYSAEGDLLWISPPAPPSPHGDEEETTTAGAPVFQLPTGMTMDASGRLVVLDAFDFELVVLDPDDEGALIASYGQEGEDDGSFIYPTGIDYDEARDWFVVADTGNDRAQIVRIEGSGGGLAAALARAWSEPLRICLIPLILLLIAAVIAVARSRANRSPKSEESEAQNLLPEQDASGRVQSDG